MIKRDDFLGPDFPEGTEFVPAGQLEEKGHLGRKVRFDWSIGVWMLQRAKVGAMGNLRWVDLSYGLPPLGRRGGGLYVKTDRLVAVLPHE